MTLAEELEMLREEVRTLRERLRVMDGGFPVEWRLTRQESRLLRSLAMRERVQVSDIIENVWWDRDEPATPEQQIRIVMVRVRKKMKPHGVNVYSKPTYGYWLDEAVRKDLRQRIGLQERP